MALTFAARAEAFVQEPSIVENGHRESRFGYIPFSRDKARRQLEQALAEERRHLVAVVEVRGRPEGFVFASVGEYHVGVGVLS